MKRYAIQIAYDGSKFYGWQKQIQSPTVQQVIETALAQIAKQPVTLIGSGRTDTGVHATGQIAHFELPNSMTTDQVRLAIRTKLPYAIDILKVWEVDADFHARYDAYQRTYHYILAKNVTPFQRDYRSFAPKYRIQKDLIQDVLPYIMGEHDFTSFCRPNPAVTNHVCHIKEISFTEYDQYFIFKISANRFLHNMVRRLVGALLSISEKELNPAIIAEWINERKQNQKNFFTALPNGLYLTDVYYPDERLQTEKVIVPIP